jgi:hypothetical protein
MTVNIAALQPGCLVAYRLLPHDMPTNPQKLWIGKVVTINWPAQCCYVELLEDGYKGLHEYVYLVQIDGLMLQEETEA